MAQLDPQPTGIGHLDELLGGGLPQGSVTLIVGVPGSGKTTLASQIVFAQAQAGKRIVILSALSESTSALIKHLSTYQFYDDHLVGDVIQILSLRQTLASGLHAAQTLVIDSVRHSQADVVLIDGIRGLQNIAVNLSEMRQFFYDVSATLATLGVTTLLTSQAEPRSPDIFPEATTADVVLDMHYSLHGVRHIRALEVMKSRGMEPIPGLHVVTISSAGISLFPQLEERVAAALLGGDAQTQGATPTAADPPESVLRELASFTDTRASFGLPELDKVLGGGLPTGTISVLAGSIGVGKTLFAINFALAGVRAGEPVVFLSFRETRDQLLRVVAPFTMGPELHASLASGALTHITVPAIKVNADIIADRLLGILDHTQAKRLVIDSIGEVEEAILRSAAPVRLRDYFGALLTALHRRGVSALFIKETRKAVASTLDFSDEPLAVLAENVVLAQHLINRGALQKLVSVLKLRYGSHDRSVHTFEIRSPHGLQVLGRWNGPVEADEAEPGQGASDA